MPQMEAQVGPKACRNADRPPTGRIGDANVKPRAGIIQYRPREPTNVCTYVARFMPGNTVAIVSSKSANIFFFFMFQPWPRTVLSPVSKAWPLQSYLHFHALGSIIRLDPFVFVG